MPSMATSKILLARSAGITAIVGSNENAEWMEAYCPLPVL